MPKDFERHWSKRYDGVYCIVGKAIGTGKPEKIWYLKYRRGDGKAIEEKAGRKGQGWTEAKAHKARLRRMAGEEPSNEEKRQAADADKKRMTLSRLAEYYFGNRPRKKSDISDKAKFYLHIEPALGKKIPEGIDPLSMDRLRASLAKKKAARKKDAFGISRGLTEGTRKPAFRSRRRPWKSSIREARYAGPPRECSSARARMGTL